jgi:hypothetical protein
LVFLLDFLVGCLGWASDVVLAEIGGRGRVSDASRALSWGAGGSKGWGLAGGVKIKLTSSSSLSSSWGFGGGRQRDRSLRFRVASGSRVQSLYPLTLLYVTSGESYKVQVKPETTIVHNDHGGDGRRRFSTSIVRRNAMVSIN